MTTDAVTTTAALEKAVQVMGGQTDLARELALRTGKPIRQGHVWSWLNRTKKVPPDIAVHIEAATAEKGAPVSRMQLCPQFPWTHTPAI